MWLFFFLVRSTLFSFYTELPRYCSHFSHFCVTTTAMARRAASCAVSYQYLVGSTVTITSTRIVLVDPSTPYLWPHISIRIQYHILNRYCYCTVTVISIHTVLILYWTGTVTTSNRTVLVDPSTPYLWPVLYCIQLLYYILPDIIPGTCTEMATVGRPYHRQ